MPSPSATARLLWLCSALFLVIAARRVAAFASSRQPCSPPLTNILSSRTSVERHSISRRVPTTILLVSPPAAEDKPKNQLPMLLDPGTRGGVLFLGLVLFILPLVGYQIVTAGFGVDTIDAGRWIGAGFAAVACLLWLSTTVFRVINKDMTYAKQLKEYENAVLAKRMEELDEDEVQALVEDLERDDFK